MGKPLGRDGEARRWTMLELWAMADRWYDECVTGPVPDSADDFLQWLEKEEAIEPATEPKS